MRVVDRAPILDDLRAAPELDVRVPQADDRAPIDPTDPRTPVDRDMAAPEEVVGRAGGPDPFRPHTRDERVTVADPCTTCGLGFF